MTHIKTDDGVNLWVEEHGSGTPVVFVHEFGGDIRSWEPQLRHFARNYRAIAFNARGYPPSEVPEDVEMYGQFRAVDDILAVLDALMIDAAHIVGLSMGGFAALHGRAAVMAASQPAWPPPTTITSKDSVGAALKLMASLSAPGSF